MKKSTSLILVLGLSLSAVFLNGCSLLSKAIKSPEVSIEKVEVKNFSFLAADLNFNLKVMNPNPINLKLEGVDYRLILNEKDIAEGVVKDIPELPAKKTIDVEIPIQVELAKVFDSLMSALKKPDSKYKITGNVRFGLISVPFVKEGQLNWNEKK